MDRKHPCENCSQIYDLYVEIESIFQNVDYKGQIILVDRLESVIYDFYQSTYDSEYKLPWTELV